MRPITRIRHLLGSLFDRRNAETRLDEELRSHLEQEIEQNLRAGMLPEAAEAAGRRVVGSLALYKEECRDARGINWFENLMREFRYALRTLRRTPLFTVSAVVTLALGIGANTTVFTFIENVLLRSSPGAHPEELVAVNWGGIANLSYPNYLDFRDRNSVFSNLVAHRVTPAQISLRARDTLRVWGYQATGNYFRTLGLEPALGRFFGPEEDRPGAAQPVLVISHRLWQTRFGSDPGIIGRKVKVNGFPFTIIGVAPPLFSGTELLVAGDYWLPLGLQPQLEPGDDILRFRASQNLWLFGRLKPGISRAAAEADISRIARQIARTYPDVINPKDKIELSRPGLVGEALRGPITGVGIVLAAVSAVVLLLACVNLAGMLLARASDRRREIGIRLALGASRGQLIRQFLVESGILALAGGGVGLALACAACHSVTAWAPVFELPINAALRPDAVVLGFTVAVALATVLLFGLTPALQSVRVDVVPTLKNEPVSRYFRRWTVRDLLVVGQIALSVILVICSLLVIRSLQHALSLNLGFRPQDAVSLSFDLRQSGVDSAHSRRFDAELLARVSALPGFDAAGIANTLPLRLTGADSELISRADRPVPPASRRLVGMFYNISPGYLRAAGTRLVAGRDFTAQDGPNAPAVALLNQTAARLLFPGEHPLGRRVRIDFENGPGLLVVGVLEEGKYRTLGEDPMAAVFIPVSQSQTTFTTLIARTRLPASLATRTLRKAVLDLNPDLAIFNTGSLADQLALPLFPARVIAVVLGFFGFLAIVLASTGLFAFTAYAVSRRRREIGLRVALGARPSQVLSSLLIRTLTLSLTGLFTGVGAALAGGRLLSAVLYGISPHDPATFGATLLLMLAVSLAACWQPASRALSIDPARTLRED